MDNTSGDFPCNKMDTRKQLPLTPSQQGFLFHSLKDKKRSNYHEHFTCIFSQHVDSAHFKWALDDAPRDKCVHFREINGIAAAFQYLQKNYNPTARSSL